MTVHTRTRQIGATRYYLGRPAAFWLNAMASRPATRKPPCDPAPVAERPQRAAQAASAAE
jgi:hypothetical protein